jgi:hypothetical protein
MIGAQVIAVDSVTIEELLVVAVSVRTAALAMSGVRVAIAVESRTAGPTEVPVSAVVSVMTGAHVRTAALPGARVATRTASGTIERHAHPPERDGPAGKTAGPEAKIRGAAGDSRTGGSTARIAAPDQTPTPAEGSSRRTASTVPVPGVPPAAEVPRPRATSVRIVPGRGRPSVPASKHKRSLAMVHSRWAPSRCPTNVARRRHSTPTAPPRTGRPAR